MYSAIQAGRRDGMQTLDQNLKEMVDSRKIDSKTAMAYATNKNMFR